MTVIGSPSTFPQRYYDGSMSVQEKPTARTGYQWGVCADLLGVCCPNPRSSSPPLPPAYGQFTKKLDSRDRQLLKETRHDVTVSTVVDAGGQSSGGQSSAAAARPTVGPTMPPPGALAAAHSSAAASSSSSSRGMVGGDITSAAPTQRLGDSLTPLSLSRLARRSFPIRRISRTMVASCARRTGAASAATRKTLACGPSDPLRSSHPSLPFSPSPPFPLSGYGRACAQGGGPAGTHREAQGAARGRARPRGVAWFVAAAAAAFDFRLCAFFFCLLTSLLRLHHNHRLGRRYADGRHWSRGSGRRCTPPRAAPGRQAVGLLFRFSPFIRNAVP